MSNMQRTPSPNKTSVNIAVAGDFIVLMQQARVDKGQWRDKVSQLGGEHSNRRPS
jgi:hypothetical protein